MNALLGPIDQDGCVPPAQQTRVAAFLLSAHSAQARQLAAALPAHLHHPWQLELHSQFCRQMEIISLLARSTSWVPDPSLWYRVWQWEMAWLPRPARMTSDVYHSLLVDLAAFGHALHAGIRPATLLPEGVAPADPFVLAMRRIEFESGRLLLAHLIVAPFDRLGDFAADRKKLRAFKEQDLRLQQPSAFEFNAAHRQDERIGRRDTLR